MSLPPVDIGIVLPKFSLPLFNPCSKPTQQPLKPDWLKRKNNDNMSSLSGMDVAEWVWLISLGAFSYSWTDGRTNGALLRHRAVTSLLDARCRSFHKACCVQRWRHWWNLYRMWCYKACLVLLHYRSLAPVSECTHCLSSTFALGIDVAYV